jgi:hypothetical protein
MLTNDKSAQRILLADFGIARSLTAMGSLTATGFTVGTIPYAAPEQLLGLEIDGRADQHALAATAYHLLAGSQLFPHSLAERPVGHAALDSILATALAKKPDDRFPRCTDFARALTLAQIGSSTVADTKQPEHATTQPRARAKPSSATRTMTPAAPTSTTTDESVYIPNRATDFGGRRSRWLGTVGIVIVLFLLAVAFFVRPWQEQGRSPSGNTSTPTSVAPMVTFEGMRDFVEGYYADLPAHPNDAWAKVDTHWQNQTGQRDFLDFWATIQSVTLVSVSPRDATSVVARVRYVPRTGQSNTEDRWLKMASVNGVMMLDESGRIGSVSESSTPPESSPTSVDTVLLTADEMSSQLGVKVTDSVSGAGSATLKMDASSYGTSDHSAQVTPPSCAGVVFIAEQNAYGDTDFQKIKTQTFSPAPTAMSATGPESVEQTAAVFPSADSAGKFVKSSQNQWDVCAKSEVGVVLGFENGRGFTLGNVQRQGDVLTVAMASWGGLNGLHACQQALGARANVVVATRTCEEPSVPTYRPGDPVNPGWAVLDAERLARAML